MKLIPVPRRLSTDCCIGLRFNWYHREYVQNALETHRVDFVALYRL